MSTNGNGNHTEIKDNLVSFINGAKNLEPALLRNFVTYWSIRKLYPLIPSNSLQQIKSSHTNLWINLVRSNHRFRAKYGEETANELIRIINENRGFVFFLP